MRRAPDPGLLLTQSVPVFSSRHSEMSGAIQFALLTSEGETPTMAKKKVFISFDFDNDLVLKELIVGQETLSDSPFEVVDTSLKEAGPMKTWKARARAAVQRSDLVIVMLGARTATAPGVLKEVAMALEAGVPIAQIIGNKGTNPTPVPNAGRVYAWDWENLAKLFG
jgi:hypothetical protein